MDAIAWLVISIVGYSLAGILLIITIFMYFKMNIPAIIGDLTGKTAEKQIQQIREQNAKTGNKRYKPNVFNVERGSLTEKVNSIAGSVNSNNANYLTSDRRIPLNVSKITKDMSKPKQMANLPSDIDNPHNNLSSVNKFYSDSSDRTELLSSNSEGVIFNETEVLNDATEVLMEATQLLDNGTEVLSQVEGTTVLYPTEELHHDDETEAHKVDFKIIKDIKITHANERI